MSINTLHKGDDVVVVVVVVVVDDDDYDYDDDDGDGDDDDNNNNNVEGGILQEIVINFEHSVKCEE